MKGNTHMKVSTAAKFIVAALAAAALAVKAAVTDGTVTPAEAVEVALAVLAAVGVYVVPNAPKDENAA